MFPRFLLCPLSPQCQSSISRDVTYITPACLISLEECVSEGGGGSTIISWSRPTSVPRLLRSSLSSSSRSEEDTDTLINFRVQSQVYVETTGCVTCFSCLLILLLCGRLWPRWQLHLSKTHPTRHVGIYLTKVVVTSPVGKISIAEGRTDTPSFPIPQPMQLFSQHGPVGSTMEGTPICQGFIFQGNAISASTSCT